MNYIDRIKVLADPKHEIKPYDLGARMMFFSSRHHAACAGYKAIKIINALKTDPTKTYTLDPQQKHYETYVREHADEILAEITATKLKL